MRRHLIAVSLTDEQLVAVRNALARVAPGCPMRVMDVAAAVSRLEDCDDPTDPTDWASADPTDLLDALVIEDVFYCTSTTPN